MARSKVLFGNWKMNNTSKETEEFVHNIPSICQSAAKKGVIVGVAPSYLMLSYMVQNRADLLVYAQEVHALDHGAYTGDVSIPMIKDISCQGALVGHSERRAYHNETDLDCNAKVKTLVKNGLGAIYCVGETLNEFNRGLVFDVIKAQIEVGLMGLSEEELGLVTIAYEPVWSIGTGKNASEQIAEDICKYIRGLIKEMFSSKASEKIAILYGGSVKPNNIHGYLAQEDVDGALVGGASLTPASFEELINNI